MTNEQVLINFLKNYFIFIDSPIVNKKLGNGRTSNTKNLKSFGTDLINYETRIAFIKEGAVFINDRKYSQTTTRITNSLKDICMANNLSVISYNPDKY